VKPNSVNDFIRVYSFAILSTIQEIILFDINRNILYAKNTSNMQHKQTFHLFDEVYTPYSQEKQSTSIKKRSSYSYTLLNNGYIHQSPTEDTCCQKKDNKIPNDNIHRTNVTSLRI